MKFKYSGIMVIPRFVVENVLTKDPLDKRVAIISISDIPANELVIDRTIHTCHFHPVAFYDISKKESDMPGCTYLQEFTPEMAEHMAEFVKSVVNNIKILVCHCVMGVSRSAGVAAAVSKYYFDEDSKYFKQYVPNTLVYTLLLKALHKMGTA